MPVKRGALGPEPRELSGRIKEARTQRGMSQARLAALVRADHEVTEVVAQDYVSRWETGTTGTSPAIQRAIARALEVSAGWLTHGTGPGITPPPWRQPAAPAERPHKRLAASTFGNEATDTADENIKRKGKRSGGKRERGA